MISYYKLNNLGLNLKVGVRVIERLAAETLFEITWLCIASSEWMTLDSNYLEYDKPDSAAKMLCSSVFPVKASPA